MAVKSMRHIAPACRRAHGPVAVNKRHLAQTASNGATLPPFAVELGSTSSSSSTEPEPKSSVKGAPWQRLTILPVLHGLHGRSGADDAAAAIRARKPRQVFVELCTARYAEVLESAVVGLPPRPPPRADIVGNIHGGLLGFELIPVLQAAREVGAAVVPVDRTRAATRNRIGQKLLSPRFIQGLLRYGIYSLQRRRTARAEDAESLRHEMRTSCPAAYDVLVAERSSYMAHQVRASAVPGADIFMACGILHTAEIVQALHRDAQLPVAGASSKSTKVATVDLVELGHKGMPVWPILTIGYVIVPGMLGAYIGSKLWTRFVSDILEMPD